MKAAPCSDGDCPQRWVSYRDHAAEIERLRAALAPFAAVAEKVDTSPEWLDPDDAFTPPEDEAYESVYRHGIVMKHFRAAREALKND